MHPKSFLNELITQATAQHPASNYDSLIGAIFSTPLTDQAQEQYIQMLRFARALQLENPAYEAVYHQLLHLFVLNGSRIDLLKGIDRRLRGLADGQSALLLISGISGIGKTSLVMAFQERANQFGAQLISGHCTEYEITSYAPWQDVARAAAAAAAAGPSIDTLLAPIGHGKEAQSSQQLKHALADWLNNCAAAKPLVILLDDLHWASADSLDVLNHLTSLAMPAPILYIATYRSEEVQIRQPLDDFLPILRRNRKVDLLSLNPLTQDDILRLVTAYHGACSPQLAAYLQDRAEGHPLFTLELLNDLVAQNLLSQAPDGFWLPPEQSVPVPAFLKRLITRRVSRLGSQVEQLLVAGAVAGEAWPLRIIEPLVGLSEAELLAAVDSALRADLITIEDDKAEIYRFSHGLIREVLYTQPLARRRKRLHEQIADQYVRQQAASIYPIAFHYDEAENWEKAVHYCQAAGEEANRRFANYSALQWYQRALNAAERAGNGLAPVDQLAIYERLGRTHMALNQRKEAEIVYGRMRVVSQSSGDLVAEGYALVNLAFVRMWLYQLDLAEKTALEALKIGEQSGDARLLVDVHACLAGLQMVVGRFGQFKDHYDQVIQHADVLENSTTLLDTLRLRAYMSIWSGQYSEAKTYANQALQMAQKSGDPLVVAGAYQNLSFAQIESGQYTEAHQNIQATLEAVEQSGTPHHQRPRLLNLMGYLYLELGDAQEALSWDRKALESIRDTHLQSLEMLRYSLLNQATDHLHLGKLDEARDAIAQFETIKEGADFVYFRYFNRYQLLMCEMHLAQAAHGQAIELAQDARSLALANQIPKNIARSHWLEAQALTGMMRFGEAMEHLEKAVGIVDGIQHGSLRWKIRLSMAAVCARAGKSPAEPVRQARDLIDQTVRSLSGSSLQAVFLASHWLKQLEQLEQIPSPVRFTYPAGLTRREVEVLQLIATGATNQQVAKALQISIRTVNTHVTNILNKTGSENRTAAGAFAIHHKLVS